MNSIFHSVRLDPERCKGCINCMKRCPTQAIRVRQGKATIIEERCIDCGECIRICQNRAKNAYCDDFGSLSNFEWNVAMPAPSFYGQFENIDDINMILTALKTIGFDDVFEVSRAAELVSHLTRKKFDEIRASVNGPVINSACSAVVRLIQTSFPTLCSNVLPVKEPFALAAQMAREEAIKKTGLPPEKIGIFFLSPCPAKVTSVKSPIGTDKIDIDGVIASSAAYKKLLVALKQIDEPEDLMQSGIVGINWATSGGESAALLTDKYITADGIENVIHVLREIEDGKLNDIDFAELSACPGGCVGGVLNAANPFVARARIKTLRKYLPMSPNKLADGDNKNMFWESVLEYSAIYRLDEDVGKAINLMKRIDRIVDRLPGLDCGSCGAPTCRAFAEDVVMGKADESDCIIKFRQEISVLSDLGLELSQIIPAPFRQQTGISNDPEGEV